MEHTMQNCQRCNSHTYLQNKTIADTTANICPNCIAEYTIAYDNNPDAAIYSRWLGSYTPPEPITIDETQREDLIASATHLFAVAVEGLDDDTKMELHKTLKATCPSADATCRIKSGWDEEEGEVSFSINYLASKHSESCESKTIAIIFAEILQKAALLDIYFLKESLECFTQRARPAYSATNVRNNYFSDLGFIFNARFAATCKNNKANGE